MCDCPPKLETSQWLTLTVDKYDPSCPAGECAVLASLDIPDEYQSCYTHYSLSYRVYDSYGLLSDLVDFPLSSTLLPPSGTGFGLPNCITAGSTIQIAMRLFADGSTDDYCEIISDYVFCERIELIERPEACTPDNLLDLWSDPPDKVIVTLNGCEYWVSYVHRKTADGNQDVQMTLVEIDGPCLNVNTDEAVFQEALATAIADIISNKANWEPQVGDAVKCVDIWRVIQNSCWSTWTCSNLVEGEEFYVYLPCTS